MIDPTLPLKVAKDPTPISSGDILCMSSLGLGGVNAHCVLRFPPEAYSRPLTTPISRQRYPVLTAPPKSEDASLPDIDVASVIAMCASQVLSVQVSRDTDLRDAGLDSVTQVRLLRKVREVLPSANLRYVVCRVRSVQYGAHWHYP
jgi:hypothetical protein